MSLETLRGALEDLVLRGVRAAGAADLRALGGLAGDLRDAGAARLATRVDDTLAAVREARADAPSSLLRTLAALRLYERVLTLDVAGDEIRRAFLDEPSDDDDGDDGDDDDEELGDDDEVVEPAKPPLPVRPPAHAAPIAAGPPRAHALEMPAAGTAAQAVVAAIEELVGTGLTAATDATARRLDTVMKEISRVKLARVAAAVRFVGDEVGRYLAKSPAFSRRRFAFFVGRAWLLARTLASAIRRDDAATIALVLTSTTPTAVKRVEVVAIGIGKRVATGTQVAFELRLRAVGPSALPGSATRLVWSLVFAHREGVPAEAFLHLPLPQKFAPRLFLDGKRVVLEDVAVALDDSGGARLLLGPKSTATVDKKPFEGFAELFAWDPERALARADAHAPTPLDLEVELAEEVVLTDYVIGAPTTREDRGQVVYATRHRGGDLEIVVSSGDDGAELRKAIEKLRDRTTPRLPLFGLLHYELAALVFQPLSVLADGAPRYLPLSTERIDTTGLLKALTF